MNRASFLHLKLKVRRNSRELLLSILLFLVLTAQVVVFTNIGLLGRLDSTKSISSKHDSEADTASAEHDHLKDDSVLISEKEVRNSLDYVHAHIVKRAVGNNSSVSNDTTTVDPVNSTESSTALSIGDFPPDAFSLQQLQHGAVILHTIGLVYTFIALAIVCDEFFVPALEVIIKRFDLSEDVAGATFMAAGGSAPELFTSLFGVFISRNSVGIGTIVGSAVFNILFVIGMCAVFSREVLQLTWWPLFRDVLFYSVSLLVLIGCYIEPYIHYYEAILLLLCYVSYVTFMKFNEKAEAAFKGFLKRHRIGGSSNRIQETVVKDSGTVTVMPTREGESNGSTGKVRANGTPTSGGMSRSTSASGQRTGKPSIRPGSAARYRHGILQLMIQTIDPLGEGYFEDRALRLHAITSLQLTLNPNQDQNGNIDTGRIKIEGSGMYYANNSQIAGRSNSKSSTTATPMNVPMKNTVVVSQQERTGKSSAMGRPQTAIADVEVVGENMGPTSPGDMSLAVRGSTSFPERMGDHAGSPEVESATGASTGEAADDDDEENQPLDLSWPTTHRKRFTYILVAPIVFLLWLTLPDVRRESKEKFYPWSFVGSILWIAVYSYLMLWWASIIGATIGVPIEVMGLTIIAAGTSVPDLLTSVIVARKGYGDMAVSSSVGSNIFDVTVGLPFPWLLGCIVNYAQGRSPSIEVSSDGLVCSIILLFIMLVLVVVSIACFGWKLNKWLGMTMFGLYVVFLVLSLLLTYRFIPCIQLAGY